MDHFRLLGILRTISTELANVQAKYANHSCVWEMAATPIMYPESRCPFCLTIIRSSGIWFVRTELIDVEQYSRLVGAIFPHETTRVQLVMPSHPHDTGGGLLCLGKNKDAFALLASTPNLRDTPMRSQNIPRWLKKYWGHDCQQMRDYLVTWNFPERVEELNRL